jgi:hypothetical protein
MASDREVLIESTLFSSRRLQGSYPETKFFGTVVLLIVAAFFA